MKSAIRRFRNAAPVPITRSTYRGMATTPLTGNGPEPLMRAYGVMSTVYSCVSLYAEASSRAEWKLFRKQPEDGRRRYSTTDTGSDQRQEVVKHAALSLIQKPNEFFTRQRLFELDQTYLDLTGEAYWVLGREAVNFPTSLWPVRPDRMDPIPDRDKYLLGWLYTSPDGREQIPLQADEVIQFAYPNPLDPMHGLGPVQSILVDIDASKYSADWNRNFFINSARPDGIVTVPDSWDDVEWQQFSDRWRETHRGVSRSHRVAILENGAQWTPNQMTTTDMDFVNLRNLTRDIVREAFRMHKVMIGVSDDVNRANAQTGEEVFASWGVIPRLERKRDVMNNMLLPMFGDPTVEFDFTAPKPGNREEDRQEMVAKCQAVQYLVDSGFDPHDALEVVGLPDMGVVEQATQSPALPPAWVPAPPAEPAPEQPGGDGTDLANLLRRVLSDGYVPMQLTGRR